MRTRWMAVGLVALTLAACGGDSTSAPPPPDEIIGTWVATGKDMPVLLARIFSLKSIRMTYTAGTYRTEGTDSSGVIAITHSGTWTASAALAPRGLRTIVLYRDPQGSGSVVEQGIFQVTGTTLKHEVMQVSPPVAGGATPPTVSSGFGQYWVGTYVKQ